MMKRRKIKLLWNLKFYSKLYCYHENSQKLNQNIYFRKHFYFKCDPDVSLFYVSQNLKNFCSHFKLHFTSQIFNLVLACEAPCICTLSRKKVIKFGLCLCLAVKPHPTAPFIQTQNKHTYTHIHNIFSDFFVWSGVGGLY